ncbi:hypothetical protein PFTANZ_06669 [Plasmodium falciparum Tanzania (2000708)]|uniref:Uncharacterized protein n=1 Tax=Plasmodium falciparum Tanzania (2000708) TaxID=1036725 RepID=A0A024VVV0_PLAFA|nr:hypothetical protein PFTANZ_06669 [Plasmodium falciparum Tanzania (2000708)]
MEGTSETTSHKEVLPILEETYMTCTHNGTLSYTKVQVITIRTNISTMCAPTSTTSNVHAILGTNFWVQRGQKHGYIKHR